MVKTRQYWVFHGVAILPPQPMTATQVNVTVSGYGKTQDEAQKDAEKSLQKRYQDKRVRLTGIAHISGPWPK
jgi:hypothetical protein